MEYKPWLFIPVCALLKETEIYKDRDKDLMHTCIYIYICVCVFIHSNSCIENSQNAPAFAFAFALSRDKKTHKFSSTKSSFRKF